MTLTEFLLAQFADDEAMARAAATDSRHSWVFVDWGGNANADHGHRWAPARVLAECEAKRMLVAGYTPDAWLLGQLALPYADHADYRKEWKP